MGLYSFTGQAGQDPSQMTGLQQYLQQGQLGINPGPQQIAASDPIAAAGKMDFAGALKNALANGPPGMNSPPPGSVPGSVNMGLFDVSKMGQNQDNPQGTPIPYQPTMGEQLGNYLQNMWGQRGR